MDEDDGNAGTIDSRRIQVANEPTEAIVMWRSFVRPAALGGVMVGTVGLGANPAWAETVRVALGDVASVETLGFLVALERAKDNGLEYDLTSFSKEELAIQAIINGQADVGVGTPYSVIQKTKVPLRNIFQVSRLVFFPVAANEYQTWQDLDGEPFTFHARGTGTEAIGDIIADREGIAFGERSYVPGSENRIVAMMNGQIKATIVDLSNKNILMEKAGDRFHVLPGVDDPASDEVVFASLEWLENHPDDANTLVESLLEVWREINENPAIVEEERAAHGLLSDLPKEMLDGVTDYYDEGVEAGVWGPEGGGAEAAKADFEFYSAAGQMEGPADSLKVEDYWYLAPLEQARAKLGG
jgi:NitT/TauT family transport system substrate-binding protein